MLLTSSTAFFLFFITFSLFPFKPKSIDVMVRVKYLKHPVRVTEGQPLTLKCRAEYEKEYCGSVAAFWCLSVTEKSCHPLTDPLRYLNHINETEIGGEAALRQRDVFVTFTQLTLNDTGFYQCKATCQQNEVAAVGHLINVTVTAGQMETTSIFTTDSNKGVLIGVTSEDILYLTISTLILLRI